jgi:hypothetical protein
MDDILHKIALKTAVPKQFPDGSQMVPKWCPNGSQNGRFLLTFQIVLAELIHGVFAFSSCCDSRCRFGHISTGVN